MSTKHRNNIYDILQALVSIPSITGDLANAHAVVDKTADLLKSTDMKITKDTIGGYPYLTATTQKPNKNMVWFVSHLDVVPAAKNMFAIEEDKQNYYGRGVFDMKGMAASVIAAILTAKDLNHANIGLLFTTDEETGGRNGVGALVDSSFAAAAAFVFDQSADWVLQQKMKGILWLQITATGKAAHGARPWLGRSANRELINYLEALHNWYDDNTPQSDPNNYYTTLNVGKLHGGEAANQVNDHAQAIIDIRFTSEDDAQSIYNAATELARRKNITVEKLIHDPCVDTDTAGFWFKQTKNVINKLGIRPGGNGEAFGHGSTDGRFFAPYNIPVISVRPSGGEQHGGGEWVSKKGLDELQKLCVELIKISKDNYGRNT